MDDDAAQPVELPHPLVDAVGTGWVETRSTRPLVGLSSGRSQLLRRCADLSMRVAVVTPPESRLTYSLFHLLDALGGAWLVRDRDGALRRAITLEPLRDVPHGLGLTPDGRPLDRQDAPSEHRLDDPSRSPDVRAGRIVPWVQLAVTTHHAARAEARLGGTAEGLLAALAPASRLAWGASEPATATWDRDVLTAAARGRMPAETRVHLAASGDGALRHRGWVRAARSADGIVEETRLLVTGDVTPAEVDAALTAVTGRQQVLVASAWSLTGAPDAGISATDVLAPQPLAVVVGARAVRRMQVDLSEARRRLDATVLGHARTPSLLVSFGADATRWHRFVTALDVVGVPELLDAMVPQGVLRAS